MKCASIAATTHRRRGGRTQAKGAAAGAATAGECGEEEGAAAVEVGSSAGTLLLLWTLKNRNSVVSLFLLLDVGVLGWDGVWVCEVELPPLVCRLRHRYERYAGGEWPVAEDCTRIAGDSGAAGRPVHLPAGPR